MDYTNSHPILPTAQPSGAFSLWTCSVCSQDSQERDAVALLQGDQPLHVSRSWMGLSAAPVLRIAMPNQFSLLAAMVPIAVYHQDSGVYWGEIRASIMTLVAMTNICRNILLRNLSTLSRAGYIEYTPAIGWTAIPMIRLHEHNQQTRERVFQAGPEWLPSFSTQLVLRRKVFDVVLGPDGRTVSYLCAGAPEGSPTP